MPPIHACGRLVAALCLAAALGGCAEPAQAVTTASPVPDAAPATISKPDGPGPFPAVVILHDCSGLGMRSSGAPGRWAKELVKRGYLVMLPDSFTPRGVPDGVCISPPPRGVDVSPDRRARDAYAALAQLRQRPDVDGRRVGVMGGSHGGSSTLATMRASGEETGDGFAAAVALYPRCAAFTGA